MNKKFILTSLISATLLLSGCGSSDDTVVVVVPVEPTLTTLFLIDSDGFSLAGVPYICDSMEFAQHTLNNGEFSFLVGENCFFDFNGYRGNYNGDPYNGDDIIHIVSDINTPANGVEYSCDSFGAGITFEDGSFDYNANDACVFYL